MRQNLLKTFIPIGVISFASELAPYILIPALPQISSSLLLSEGQGTALISLYYLALFISYGAAGLLSGIMPKKRVLLLSALLMMVGALTMATANGFVQLVMGRIVQALGAGFVIIVAQTWIAELATSKSAARLFMLLSMSMSVAPLLSPIIGGYISQFQSWQYIFYLLAVVTALSLVAIFFSSPPKSTQSKIDSPRKVFGEYGRLLTKTPLINRFLSVIACFFFIGSFMSYSSYLFIDELGVSESLFGFISVPSVVGTLIGQYIVVRIEKWRGLKTAYRFATVVAIVALLISLLPTMGNVYGYVAIFTLFSIGFGAHYLIAIRSVMVDDDSSHKSYTSTLVNQITDLTNFVSAGVIQLAFLWITTTNEIHIVVSIISILALYITYNAGRKSIY